MGTIIAYLTIITLLLSSLLRSGKKGKGRKGEKKVSSILRSLGKSGKYEVLDDILVRKENGFTAQIDHVVVSEAGVFVVETKNYKGRIEGEPNGQEWIQDIKGHVSFFENPLIQNRGHIAALKGLLSGTYPELKYLSLAVFPSRHLLKVDDPRVVSRSELKGEISSHSVKSLSPEEVDSISKMIRSANITSRKERRKHVRDAKRQQKQRKRKY